MGNVFSEYKRYWKCQKQCKSKSIILVVLLTKKAVHICGSKGSKIFLMLSLISNRPERYFKSSFWKAAISNSYTHDIYTRVYRLGLLETKKGIKDLHICKTGPG